MRFRTAATAFRYLNWTGRNVGYIGWVGYDNLGDEALLQACRECLFPDVNLLPYRRSPYADAMARVAGPLYSAVLLGGGTLIGQGGEVPAQVRHALDRGHKLYGFGAGVEDPEFSGLAGESRLAEWLPLLQRFACVWVRGPRSRKLLADRGIHAEAIGDPAIAFAGQSSRAPLDRCLGINVGTSYGRIFGGDEGSALAFVTDVCRRFLREDWSIRILPVWCEDEPLCSALAGRLKSERVELRRIRYNRAESYLDAVADVTVMLGMKLHSVVLAHCRGVPSLMLAYRPKCVDYMLHVGQGDRVIRTDALSVDDAVSRLLQLASDRRRVSAALAARLSDIRRDLLARAATVSSSILSR